MVSPKLCLLVSGVRSVQVDYLAADLIPALGLISTIEHLPTHLVRDRHTALGDPKIQLLARKEQAPDLKHLSQGGGTPAVLSDCAVDRKRVLDVDGLLLLDELFSVVE